MRSPFSVSIKIVLFIFACCFALPASAQFRAAVQGTVTDPQGATVSGATVTLTSKETGKSQQTTSGDQGFYRFSELAPGKYSVLAEQPGFKKHLLDDIDVSAEQTQGINITLETGSISETVTVQDSGTPALETENANVDKQITTEEIHSLPQQGRDPYSLLRLAPGVFGDASRGGAGGNVPLPNNPSSPAGNNRGIFATENEPQIIANGQRVTANDFQIDGVSVNSQTHGGSAVVTPNQESIKEIQVISSSYSAEDGRNSGAQIKIVSQNGTNEFHGSAFLKYNSPKLNAFNQYGGPSSPPVRNEQLYRQFGGSIGGPIIRDRTFFFGDYEKLGIVRSLNPRQVTVPTLAQRQLVNATPASTYDSVGLQYFNLYPLPNGSGAGRSRGFR